MTILYLFSLSQNKSDSLYQAMNDYKEADGWYKKALKVNAEKGAGEEEEAKYNRFALEKFSSAEKLLPPGNDSLRFFLSLKAGELCHYFDSLASALHYYNQAILLKTAHPFIADSFLFKPYLFSGQIYFSQNQLAQATNSFKKAEEILNAYHGQISESQRLYNLLGVLYHQGGNYFQAGNYFRKAAEMLDRKSPYFADFYVNYQINYGISLFKLQKYEKASAILKNLLPYQKHLDEIYNNLGLIAACEGRFGDALEDYRKVHYQNVLDIGLDNDKAAAWLGLNAYDSARLFLDAAWKKYKKYNGKNYSIDHGLTLKTYGDLEAAMHRYEKALGYYQQAINQFYPSFAQGNVQANPVKFTGVFSYINLFHTLVAKAEALHSIYNNTQDIGRAENELQTFVAAFELLDYIEKVYDSDEARLFLEKSKYLIHEKPIDIAFELHRKTHDPAYLEMAYEIDQKSKASILAFNDQRNQSIQSSSPARNREQSLKREITRLSLSAGNLTDPVTIEDFGRKITDLEIRLGKIQDTLAQIYPAAAVSVPSIPMLQKHFLDPQTMLISYHFGKNSMTTFTITSSRFNALQQSIYPEFREDVKQFIQQLHQPSDTGYSDIYSKRLSAYLLPNLLDKDHQRLIIIPDDDLNYLPFEALKDREEYLIQNYSIQYQYSTSLLKKETADFIKASTLSFAPFTDLNYTDSVMHLDQLTNSGRELQKLRGTSFIGSAATKQNFLNNIHGKDIIHLATHAVANDSSGSDSYIVFAPWHADTKIDYLLYSAEIYNLSMRDNKLIVLSACETGYGNLVKGEGLMSLSRAFAYAGCPDIITSLWKADDESTAYIAHSIHRYLQKGLPVDKALQQSKRDYLNDRSINPRRKHPAYWANLVFIGNYRPLTNSYWRIWIIGGIILIIAILLFLRLPLRAPGHDTDARNRPGSF